MPPLHIIPFELRHNHIVLAATVNDRPARLILDSGSSVSTLDRGWASSLGLTPLDTPAAVRGVGDVPVTLATVRSTVLGSVDLREETVALMPFEDVSAAHGVPIHGTIGFTFFSRFVVAIDYVARELRLWAADEGETIEPWTDGPGDGGPSHVIPIDLTYRIPVTDVRLVPAHGDPFTARLVLDLGTSGFSALLNPRTHAANRDALDAAPFITASLGAGIGGTASGRVTRLERLEIGTLTITRPILALSGTSGGFFDVTWADGTIGAPSFATGTIVLDYPRRRVIIESAGRQAPAAIGGSGLQFRSVGPQFEVVEVFDVVAGSPADRAGIRAGDRLVAVGTDPAAGEGLDRIVDRLQARGEQVELTVARDGAERVVRLTLEELV